MLPSRPMPWVRKLRSQQDVEEVVAVVEAEDLPKLGAAVRHQVAHVKKVAGVKEEEDLLDHGEITRQVQMGKVAEWLNVLCVTRITTPINVTS